MNIDVTKYQPVIDRVLAKVKVKSSQREDYAQECYLALLERQNELGENDEEKAYSICRSRINGIRQTESQRAVKEENRVKFVSADVPNVARQLNKIAAPDGGEISESELHEAIATLPEGVREVIKAIFVTGLTEKRAAEELGMTRRVVWLRKKTGIEILKRHFEVDRWA